MTLIGVVALAFVFAWMLMTRDTGKRLLIYLKRYNQRLMSAFSLPFLVFAFSNGILNPKRHTA